MAADSPALPQTATSQSHVVVAHSLAIAGHQTHDLIFAMYFVSSHAGCTGYRIVSALGGR